MKRNRWIAPVVVASALSVGAAGGEAWQSYAADAKQHEQQQAQEKRIMDARTAIAAGYTSCKIVAVKNEGPSLLGGDYEGPRTRVGVTLQLASSKAATDALNNPRNQGYVTRDNEPMVAIPYMPNQQQFATKLAEGNTIAISGSNESPLPDNGTADIELAPRSAYKPGTKAVIYASRKTFKDNQHDIVSGTYCGTMVAQKGPGGIQWNVDPNPPAWPNVQTTVTHHYH